MKKIFRAAILFTLLLAAVYSAYVLFAARRPDSPKQQVQDDYIVIGFSQLGAESDWRNANTESMKNTFTKQNGYQLLIEDGQQKQANQIMAIRKFIQQDVDYIVLAPVTETGWDTVLQEAKDAGIPVIIVDRMVDVEDEELFTCWIGSNFELEGRKAAEWLNQYIISNDISAGDVHIADIQGTMGASAQIGRSRGLEKAVAQNGWDLVAQVNGDFTQTKGKEAMRKLLRQYQDINVVYCENDNEALGAIEAINDAGRKTGVDITNGEIMILSFDGVNRQAMNYLKADKIALIAECNPMHGPRVQALIELLEAGQTPEKYNYIDEKIFCGHNIIESVYVDGQEYPVTIPSSRGNY